MSSPTLPVNVELADLDLDVAAVPRGEEGGSRYVDQVHEVLDGDEAPHHLEGNSIIIGLPRKLILWESGGYPIK